MRMDKAHINLNSSSPVRLLVACTAGNNTNESKFQGRLEYVLTKAQRIVTLVMNASAYYLATEIQDVH